MICLGIVLFSIQAPRADTKKALGVHGDIDHWYVGRVFTDCENDCPEMIVVPSHNLTSSSLALKKEDLDSGNAARLKISSDLAFSRTHITVKQFRRFVHEAQFTTYAERDPNSPCHSSKNKLPFFSMKGGYFIKPEVSWRSPDWQINDDQPVVCLTYDDIDAYIKWLNIRTQKNYRLPTLDEWELVALTDQVLNDNAPCGNLYGRNHDAKLLRANYECPDVFNFVAPVRSFKPDHIGLYDTAGNVMQLTSTCFDGDLNFMPDNKFDLLAGVVSGERIKKICTWKIKVGCTWRDTTKICHRGKKEQEFVEFSNVFTGFRLVRARL